ncbi:MFS transporter [Alphaproteobacteria bacterium]|nr:MFS transporter [Alphaproteobacteria bacterium]
MEKLSRSTTPKERTRGLSLLFICLLSLGMGQSLFFALLPPIARDLGLSEVQVSAIFTLSAVLWVVMSPFWGRRSDVWGRKPVILLGLTGFGISTGGFGILLVLGQQGVMPLMTLYVMMIFVRAIFGLLGSGTPSAAQAYVADRTSRAERTSGVAAIGAAFGMGTITGPGFAAVLASFHLIAPFFALAIFALAGAVTIAIFLPERRGPKEMRSEMPRLKISDPRIRPFLFMGVAVSMIQAAVMQVAAFFVMDTLLLDGAQTAQLVGGGMMSMAMATLFAQLVVIPRANLSVRSLLTWGIGINVIGVALLLIPMSPGVFIFALTLQGFGMGLMRPAVAAGGSLAVTPDEQGAIAGLNSSTAAVGIIFVPVVAMPLYLILPTGPFWIAFFLSIAMLLLTRSKALDVLETPIDVDEVEEETLSRVTRH